MNGEIFLIDSNSLITPYLNFYPFDFAGNFWRQMESHITDGEIAILDAVKNEVLQGKDKLREWMEHIDIGNYIDHREPQILQQYGEVLSFIQGEKCYKTAALAEWARGSSADPWLIATAKVKDYTIITFETHNNNLSTWNPSKRAKIPDVADAFGVRADNLYYMMRALDFKL